MKRMKSNRFANLTICCLIFALATLTTSVSSYAQNVNEELIAAARKSNVEMVKSLLDKGADVNAKTEYGATPLFFACDRGSVEVVKVLLEHGAQVDIKDKFYGATPIFWAVQRDHAEVVKLLLQKSPQSKDSVMQMAVGAGQPKTVKMLLEMGDFKPESLSNYLMIAEKNKSTEVADILKKAGAQPKPKVDYKVDAETLKLYEGDYKNEQVEVSFKLKDGKLVGSQGGQEFNLVPIAKHTFELEAAPGVIAVFNFAGEKITGVAVKQSGGEMVLKKVEVK